MKATEGGRQNQYYLLGATLCNFAISSKSVSKLPSCYEVLVPVVFLITFKLCPI